MTQHPPIPSAAEFSLVRTLYNEACYGAGADARWAARDKLHAMAHAAGLRGAFSLLERHGLNLDAYWATKPISRPSI